VHPLEVPKTPRGPSGDKQGLMIVTDSCGSLTQGKAKIGRFQPTVSQKAIETIVKKYKPYIKDDPTKIITGALGSSPSKENSSGTKPTTAAAPNA
jgi:hypothetical protein